MLAVLTATAFAQGTTGLTWEYVYNNINWDADYTDDRIIVTLDPSKHHYTDTLTLDDFPEADFSRIKELTMDNQCQIISLYLTNTGRDQVKTAIEALETNPIVWFAEPNHVYYVDLPGPDILSKYPIGDVNMDYKLGLKDAVIIIQYRAGYDMEWTEDMNILADMNEDGTVDLKDVTILIKRIASF